MRDGDSEMRWQRPESVAIMLAIQTHAVAKAKAVL